jgi:VWFA-related protein
MACITARAWQAPVFQSETKVVLVDAVVTDKKGEYIRDLTAKDFRVWDNNREQTIRSFSVETDTSAAEARRLVMFFDDTGMSAATQAGVRRAAAGFIDAYAGPNRLMAVVDFDSGFRVTQSFTGDAGRLKEAVRGVKFTASNPGGPGSRGRLLDSQDAGNARGLMQSVGTLARNLNALPGRKIVVLFTGGGDFAASGAEEEDAVVQLCNRSNVAVYPVAQAVAQDQGADAGLVVRPRNGVPANIAPTIQPADVFQTTIARGTGGFVVPGSDYLPAELQKIGAEQSRAYVLGYTLPASPLSSKDAPCHTLRVKVDRGGAEVRSRSSYCAAKPTDVLAESKVEQDLEKRAAAAQTGAAASIQAPFFYAAPYVARVHVAMEIATDALKFENQKGKLHAEMNVLGIAAAPDGATAARFSDILKRDFDSKQDVDKWQEKPLYYAKEFKIIPGQYILTVVFSSGGASFGKVVTPLTVPAYDGSQFAISALALSKQIRPASDLGLEASLIDEGTPLVAGGAQVFPAGSNAFARSEQAFCYFEVYAPAGAASANLNLRASLRILESRTGTPKWDSGVAKLDPPAGGKSTIPVGLNVPFASLPAGSYRLEATVTDGSEKTVKRIVDFQIK